MFEFRTLPISALFRGEYTIKVAYATFMDSIGRNNLEP